MVLDGPMNRAGFQACIEQVLVPILPPDDAVIRDRLPATSRQPGISRNERILLRRANRDQGGREGLCMNADVATIPAVQAATTRRLPVRG